MSFNASTSKASADVKQQTGLVKRLLPFRVGSRVLTRNCGPICCGRRRDFEMSDAWPPAEMSADDEMLVAIRFLIAHELGDDEAALPGGRPPNDLENVVGTVRRGMSAAMNHEAKSILLDRLALALELELDDALVPRGEIGAVDESDELLIDNVLTALRSAVLPEMTITLVEDVERWLVEATQEPVSSRDSTVALAPKLLRVPWLCAHGWSDEVELAVEVDESAARADLTVHVTALDTDAASLEIGLVDFPKTARVEFGVATLRGIPHSSGPLKLWWRVT
jgi:hypothetical protein